MTRLTPTERLEWLRDRSDLKEAKNTVVYLLGELERFLYTTNFDEEKLVHQFTNKDTSRKYMEAAHEFGDSMFEALTIIGNKNPFHRLLVV
jgi:hypothetical protein